MKKLAVIGFVLLFANCFSQNKCKFDYDKEDKVTGNKVQYFQFKLSLGSFPIQIGNNGPLTYFSFGYDMLGDKYEQIKKDTDTLYIRLQNKSLLKLNVKENTKGASHINQIEKQIYTYYTPSYSVNEEQLKLLSESPIIAFRFLIEGKDYSVEVPEKKAVKIMEGYNCLRTNK